MIDCPKGYYCLNGTGYLPFDLNILNDPTTQYPTVYSTYYN